MLNILIIISVAIIIWSIEHLVPNNTLEPVQHWYQRALIFNSTQAAIAMTGANLWDVWFAQYALLSFSRWALIYQVLLGYLTITFLYYWWHRLRHSVPVLWRYLHQFHHSPVRIEVITSFYKNPLEMLANSLLTSGIVCLLLGLSPIAVGLCVLVTGLAEMIYHMNIQTPRVMGFFFQRPEMHRIHHQQGLHHYNYSDLPIWDMLFGTYKNPPAVSNQTGFPDNNENRMWDLLRGRELTS